ncbi:MAG: helix-turn-helix transcriptional regulator [Thermoactinomyces vulgaris]
MNETGSTRMQIMTMLKTEGGLTVSEIAERLGVTEMAVRRHMNQLERDQLIVPQLLRKSMGRPSNQYFLTERSEQYFPKMYAGFAMEILKDLEENYGEEMIQSVFKNREKRLLKEHLSDFQGKSLDEKVRRLAELQDEKGYMVKWEKEGEGVYRFVECNCPISQVASVYNQACQCEMNWFCKLLDAEVEQEECKAMGGQNCVYVIRERKE